MKIDPPHSVDELFDSLPGDERLTAVILRDLVREVLPHAREKLSWGAPFYYGRRSICYIWPASIPWGKLDEGVALGFTKAYLMDHGGFLNVGERKQLGRHVFMTPEEIDVETVVKLLREAGEIDAAR